MTKSFLDSASEAYYKGTPIISDTQFDSLAKIMNYDKVGNSAEGTCTHYNRLYSLQKYYEDEKHDNPLVQIADTSCSVKLDGAAISLLYVDGSLSKAITRGDGVVGQDVTDKFLATNLVPKYVNFDCKIVQVSGEIVAPLAVENSRNYAAGSLNLKDINEFKTRAITFIAYNCYPTINETYDQDMLSLERYGFRTVKELDLDKVYPCDGIVFRVNNNAVAASMGHTSNHPKCAYALKERQECVETQILSVEWDTGRTGRVTPVAILEPVFIGDKKVSRATLNNPKFIEALGLCLGDTIGIRLAGMIIPEVVYKVDA